MMGLKIGIRADYAQEMEPDTLLKGTIDVQVKASPKGLMVKGLLFGVRKTCLSASAMGT
jgi:hypothetical protein